MLQYFFTPEYEIPSGAGFCMYDRGHLSALSFGLSLTILVLQIFRRRSPDAQNRLMKILSVSMVVMELAKDFILAALGAFTVGYLPLHLCSLSMFVCLYYAFHPNSRSTSHILYSVVLPGAIAALLFPNWTRFPLLHFQSIHSFLYHTLLVLFSLMPLVFRRFTPGLRGIIPSLLFLLGVSVPVGILNQLLGTNYMFLSGPSKGSPLESLALLPGKYGYLAGYLALVLAVLFLMNLPFSVLSSIRKRPHRTM